VVPPAIRGIMLINLASDPARAGSDPLVLKDPECVNHMGLLASRVCA
jgi:hypothetical protein